MSNGDWEKRLTEIEIVSTERWRNNEARWNQHDKRSEQQWGMVNENLRELKDLARKRPCESHIVKLDNLAGQISSVWWAISVLLIGGIVLGVWLKAGL